MRRTMVCVALTVITVAPALGHAAEPRSGTILVPAATAGCGVQTLCYGVSDLTATCDPSASTNGIDGIVFWLDDAEAGLPFVLMPVGDTAAAQDFSMIFYAADCFDQTARVNAGSVGQSETGIVPELSKYVQVNLFAGANGSFELTIG